MAKKTALTYQDRQQLEFLTSHLRSSAPAYKKAKYENQIAALLEGKELTRGDMALAAYYTGNSGTDAGDAQISQAFAQAYRDSAPQ